MSTLEERDEWKQHDHKEMVHKHGHFHVTHSYNHRAGGFDHLSAQHEHEHDHAHTTHAHYPHQDIEHEHEIEVHDHDHGEPVRKREPARSTTKQTARSGAR
jgi:hypothetical protein